MTLYFEPRLFYAPHPEGPNKPYPFIIITEGVQGYRYTAMTRDQETADNLNRRQGITPAQVQAAIACSMFDCWKNFDKITASHEEHTA